MSARLLDGKTCAEQIRLEIASEVKEYRLQTGVQPCLAAVLVGDDPASQIYVRNKHRDCVQVGMLSSLHQMPSSVSIDELLELLDQLNRDRTIHGILVQTPLPKHLDTRRVLDAILPIKDIDCFAPENVGLLSQGRPRYLPCTPHGVIQLLSRSDIRTAGREVVVVGRSDIVGKPLALMLMQKDGPCGPETANATVTCCHSQSHDLARITQRADILIVAIGKANAITGEMIRPGAVVIDVGINREEGGIVGDVAFEAAREVASAITPVPGGIGPLTRAMLLRNTLSAAKLQIEDV